MKPYYLCLHDLRLPTRLGIFPHEREYPQTLELSLELLVDQDQCDFTAEDGVPCYATLTENLRRLLMDSHTGLCEQLAHRIARMCFEDARILSVEVMMTKPAAVANAAAGIRMTIARKELSD